MYDLTFTRMYPYTHTHTEVATAKTHSRSLAAFILLFTPWQSQTETMLDISRASVNDKFTAFLHVYFSMSAPLQINSTSRI